MSKECTLSTSVSHLIFCRPLRLRSGQALRGSVPVFLLTPDLRPGLMYAAATATGVWWVLFALPQEEFGTRDTSGSGRGTDGRQPATSAGFSGGYFACFFANRTLNVVLMATMPAKKITSPKTSPLDTLPTRKRM